MVEPGNTYKNYTVGCLCDVGSDYNQAQDVSSVEWNPGIEAETLVGNPSYFTTQPP